MAEAEDAFDASQKPCFIGTAAAVLKDSARRRGDEVIFADRSRSQLDLSTC